MSDAKDLPIKETQKISVVDIGEFSSLMDSDRFSQLQRIGNMFAQSDLVPEVFSGKPANCMVALQMAFRLGIDPMMMMQSMYIVKGKPGIEAKLAIALINSRGPFMSPIQWVFEGEGDERQCTAYATHRQTKERCAATVTWKQVKAEGWLDKPGSKWKTLPDLMFQYRSASFLGRLYCPETILGLQTKEELIDAEHEIAGERVDERPKIRAPRSKQIAESPPEFKDEPDLNKHDVKASVKDIAIEQRNADVIDQHTGEIVSPKTITPEDQYKEAQREFDKNADSKYRLEQEPQKKDLTEEERKPITRGLCSVLKTKMEGAGLTLDDCKAKFGKTIEQLNFAEADDVMDWINTHNSGVK